MNKHAVTVRFSRSFSSFFLTSLIFYQDEDNLSVSESPDDQVMVKEDEKVPESPPSAVGTEESKVNLQNKGILNT